MNEASTQTANAASDKVAAASQRLQAFAAEMQQMGKESVEQATQLLEQLRNAKTVEEVVSLQTSFMQRAIERYTAFTTKMGALMTSPPPA